MRLAIVTDAWRPQVNGVVRSLEHVAREMRERGDDIVILAPERFRTIACPTYPEIRLSLASPAAVSRLLDRAAPDYVHVATEGPLGLLARRHCLRTGRGYTTSYHTKFPEYVAARLPVPQGAAYRFMRWFHNGGHGCMVATNSLERDLEKRGFQRLMRWPRGVDATLFHPVETADLGLPRPVFMNVGRVAVEKNLQAFLSLDLPGSKVVVGDGPATAGLKARHPDVHFLGSRTGEALARAYAAADVFVFPSLTDTFGNVLLEALACGVPVAAYPVTGPTDVLGPDGPGVLDHDLKKAALEALDVPRERAREHALRFSWAASMEAFRANIVAAHAQAA